MPDHLDQQHLDRRRQVAGPGDPAFDEIAGDVGQPQRHDQQHAELDQHQRRQPQAAEHDRDRIERIDRRLELADDAERRDQPCRQRHQADDEFVADHRGDEADDQPGQRELGGDRRADSCGSARSTATSRRVPRHQHGEYRGRGAGDQHPGEHAAAAPASPSPARSCRPERDRRARGERDPGAGQDQAELQIEPGRGDFGADRARGGMQESAMSRPFPSSNLVGKAAASRNLIRICDKIPTTAARTPSLRRD